MMKTHLILTSLLLLPTADGAESHVATLETALKEVEASLDEARERRQFADRVATLEERQEELRSTRQDLEAELERLRGELAGVSQALRTRRWEKAVGTTFTTLTTTKGREYFDVTITQIEDSLVSIRHRDGSMRLQPNDLPEEQRNRFALDQDEAEAALARAAKLPPPVAPRPPKSAAPPADRPAPQGDAQKVQIDRGKATARAFKFFRGGKRVEFTAYTNCPATLTIYNVLPNRKIVRVPVAAKEKKVVDYDVANDYRCTLTSSKGIELDTEKTRKKTRLGDRPELGK